MKPFVPAPASRRIEREMPVCSITDDSADLFRLVVTEDFEHNLQKVFIEPDIVVDQSDEITARSFDSVVALNRRAARLTVVTNLERKIRRHCFNRFFAGFLRRRRAVDKNHFRREQSLPGKTFEQAD